MEALLTHRRRRRRWRHLEIQVNIQARELYLEFVPMDLDSDETSWDIGQLILKLIEVRDSRGGYLVPGHVGPGLRQMSRVGGKPPPSSVPSWGGLPPRQTPL